MKILNLYACLGGNRLLWENCEVTAVELDPELAKLYQERFPNDTVIVADAHQYLLDHFKEFDFIWSSPPCPDNSRARFWRHSQSNPVYPDLRLYQEVILLEHHFKGNWVVENVIPYYEPLIPAQKRGRHLYWTNFKLPQYIGEREFQMAGLGEVDRLCEFHNYDFRQYKGKQRIDKIARNLVDYEAGLTIFNVARGVSNTQNSIQSSIQFG